MEIIKKLKEKNIIKDNFHSVMQYLKTNNDITIKDDNDIILDRIKIEEYIYSLDLNFLNFLQKNEVCLNLFFKTTNKFTIFDTISFKDCIFNTNEYIANSKTKFKNKISLISDVGNIVLDFPYKDCVLIGGMNKNEEKNKIEAFYNITLDKNLITKLFSPKVLTNFKFFNQEENINENQNYIIKGNNLIGLHTLKSKFKNKIDCIYIDPPYFFNETKEADTFTYNSNFKLSTWLVFMKNRLEVAKQLLNENSIIFISINESAIFELKILCDSIFGKENFIRNMIWNKCNAQNDATYIQENHEYILIYKKGDIELSSVSESEKPIIEKNGKLYYKKSGGLLVGGSNGYLSKRINLGYSIYYNKETDDIITLSDYDKELAKISNNENEIYLQPDKNLINNGYICIRPPKSKGKLKRWTWDINKFNKDKDKILISSKGSIFVLEEVNPKDVYLKDGKKFVNVLTEGPLKSITNISSSNGTKDLSKISQDFKFDNPKPVDLIRHLLKSFKNEDALVLDFFGGSGTTAQAVLELNKEDSGNRNFILLEQLDYIENLTTKRIELLLPNSSDSFVYAELQKTNIKEEIINCNSIQELINIIDINFDYGFFPRLKTKESLINSLMFFSSTSEILSLDDTKKEIIEKVFDHNLEYSSLDNLYASNLTEKEIELNKNFFGLE